MRNNVFLSVILFMGLFLRWFDVSRVGLWTDEFYTLFYSLNLSAVIEDSHTPFNYFLTKPFLSFLGVGELSLRLPSLLLSSSFLLLCWWEALKEKNLTAKQTKIWFLVLLCFSPLDIILSREARMYEFMLVFSGISFLWALKYIQRPRKSLLVGISFLSLFNFFNHPATLIFGLSVYVYIFFMISVKNERLETKECWPLIWGYSLASLPTFFYYFVIPGKFYIANNQITHVDWPSIATPWVFAQGFLGQVEPFYDNASVYIDASIICVIFTLFAYYAFYFNKRFKHSTFAPLLIVLLHFSFMCASLWKVNFFNYKYSVSLYSVLIYVLATLFRDLFKAKRSIIIFVASLLLLYLSSQLLFFRPHLSAREHIQELNQLPEDYLIVPCNFGKFTKARRVIYPLEREGEIYCYNLERTLLELRQKPRDILIYINNRDVSDKDLAKTFLDQKYQMIGRDVRPSEFSLFEYYVLKNK